VSNRIANAHRASPLILVLLGGLVAAALDITFAFVFYGFRGVTPTQIVQGIAFALIGPRSFELGAASALLGGFLHFFICVCAAGVYYAASRYFPFLTRRIFTSGAIFGVLMYVAMHFVILPLSYVGLHIPKLVSVIGELGSHIFLFGFTIAFAVSRARARADERSRPESAEAGFHHIKSSGTT